MTTYNLDFNLYDHSFCEMNIYGKSPEYINSFSSLCLTFFGLFGLIMHNRLHDIKMIYTAMIFNGIASFMYHYSNQLGWGLLDRFSMILIALPCYSIAIRVLEVFNFCSFFYDILRFVVITYLSYLMTIVGLHQEELFNTLFAIFLVNLFIFVVFIQIYNKKLEIPKEIVNYSCKGILLIIIAGAFWIMTEKFCNTHWIIKYLFGHTIWHFCIAYGGYLLTLVPIYLFDRYKYLKIDYFLQIPYIKLN